MDWAWLESAFSLKMSNHYTKMAGTVREKKEPLALRFAICIIVIYVSRWLTSWVSWVRGKYCLVISFILFEYVTLSRSPWSCFSFMLLISWRPVWIKSIKKSNSIIYPLIWIISISIRRVKECSLYLYQQDILSPISEHISTFSALIN